MENKQIANDGPSLEAIHQTASGYFRALGLRIVHLRQAREMSQRELARVLGLSQQAVNALESGDRKVRIDWLPILSKTFEISADELLGIRPLPPPIPTRITARQLRHLETLKKLSAADQRFIIRLAESMSGRP